MTFEEYRAAIIRLDDLQDRLAEDGYAYGLSDDELDEWESLVARTEAFEGERLAAGTHYMDATGVLCEKVST